MNILNFDLKFACYHLWFLSFYVIILFKFFVLYILKFKPFHKTVISNQLYRVYKYLLWDKEQLLIDKIRYGKSLASAPLNVMNNSLLSLAGGGTTKGGQTRRWWRYRRTRRGRSSPGTPHTPCTPCTLCTQCTICIYVLYVLNVGTLCTLFTLCTLYSMLSMYFMPNFYVMFLKKKRRPVLWTTFF